MAYERSLIDKLVADRAFELRACPTRGASSNKWLVSSDLHKAIRRGLATRAASDAIALHRADSAYAWKRLATIAVEDISVGDIESVAACLAVCGKTALHRAVGAETLIAKVASSLAEACKSRTACDLVCLADSHLEGKREPLSNQCRTHVEAVCDPSAALIDRACALRLIAGLSYRVGHTFKTVTRIDRALLQEVVERLGVPIEVAYVALSGKAPSGLGVLALLSHGLAGAALDRSERTNDSTLESEEVIGDVLSCAYCMYTRDGQASIREWLARDRELATYTRHAGAADLGKAIGYIVFQEEGSFLRRELVFSQSDVIRRELERIELLQLGVRDAQPLRKLLRRKLPGLHQSRALIAAHQRAQLDWIGPGPHA